jgi:hypothetical protein
MLLTAEQDDMVQPSIEQDPEHHHHHHHHHHQVQQPATNIVTSHTAYHYQHPTHTLYDHQNVAPGHEPYQNTYNSAGS